MGRRSSPLSGHALSATHSTHASSSFVIQIQSSLQWEIKCVVHVLQGQWRKVIVDDLMPFDEDGQMLLPTTENPVELWAPILSKALLKVASLE